MLDLCGLLTFDERFSIRMAYNLISSPSLLEKQPKPVEEGLEKQPPSPLKGFHVGSSNEDFLLK